MLTYSFEKRRNNNISCRIGKLSKNAYIEYGRFSKYTNGSAVYGIKCKITNKIYIGATKNLHFRLLKHFNELYHNRHRTKLLQREFNKYTINNFEIIVYDNIDKNNLLKSEKEIQISIGIDNLYNEKISGYWIKEEYRKQLANSNKDSHRTKEYREKMSKLKTNKIAQFDVLGNIIKVWESAIKICETLGYTKSVILSCCNGSKPKAYGYKWRYIDDNGNILKSGYTKARSKQ